MALQFKPLKLENTDLFGVSLSGSVGRGDTDRLKELADKCLLNGKVNVVLDLSELGVMSGGGARMIAKLQERLAEADGSTVIAGAGETVKRFLDQKLESNSLSYFATVEDLLVQHGGGSPATAVDHKADESNSPDPALSEDPDDIASGDDGDEDEVGAIGFCDDDETEEMDSLLGEFKVAETKQGRRKDHRYTSLEEALSILGTWSDQASQLNFTKALKNLLFSQGLAEDVTLLMAQGGLLISPDGYKEIPLDGSLATQAEEISRPLTILDIRDDDLTEEEISLLEAVDPDLILPVLRQGVLNLLIFIKKGGDERDYSVTESFAFELLQQIMEGVEQAKAAATKIEFLQSATVIDGDGKTAPVETEADFPVPPPGMSSIMLRMSLDMPEADDLPHFWRLFARHLQQEMELQEMAFLVAGRNHPQIMLGGDNTLTGLDCAEERLQKFFQSMERPVLVANLPTNFASLKKELKASRVNWVIPLNWEDEFLGTLFVAGTIGQAGEFSDSLEEAFGLASRLLVRFEDESEDADVYLDLVYKLMAQREKRFFGSESMTKSIVDQLSKLALEMGFPSDQKRDLIYGCLLRDVGLIDKDDALMGSPADMTPNQWKAYRNHPTEGAALLGELNLSQTALEVVKCHHERFNGEGFPAGLSGRDIPLAARVVTVVENYVGMTTGLGGLEPRSPEEVAQAMRENLGERYDPDIVGIFLSVIGAD